MSNHVPKEPTLEQYNRLNTFSVNKDTGIVYEHGIPKGSRRPQDGRWVIAFGLNGKFKQFLRSHVVWYLVTGKWPTKGLDHKDRNCDNDAFENLREKSQGFNAFNKKVKADKTTSLPVGVHLYKNGKYMAKIGYRGKEIHLGYFVLLEDAINARKQAELKYYGEHHADS